MADPTVPPPAARGTEPTREPMSEDRLELARNHTRRLVRDLAAEVDRLRAASRAGSEDTARLDWLDDVTHQHQTPEFWMEPSGQYSVAVGRALREYTTAATLRDAIDAMREPAARPEHGGEG